jgi:predicted DNA binding CopG/RHH family protein
MNKNFMNRNLKRKDQIHMMVSSEEKAEIERKAHIQGLTVSRYLRWLVTTDNSTSICDKKSVDF